MPSHTPIHLLPPSRDPASLTGRIDLEAFTLRGKSLRIGLGDVVTGGDIESTIEGAPTLSLKLRDAENILLRGDLFDEFRIRMSALRMVWELMGVTKDGDDLTLDFENGYVAQLRRETKSARAHRDIVTRAVFVRNRVLRVPGLRFYAPELRRRQPIARPESSASAAADAGEPRAGISRSGFAPGVQLRGKEGTLGRGQLRNATIALREAARLKAGPRATLALIMAYLVEGPDFKNPTGGHGTSVGGLQLTNIHLNGSSSTRGGRRDITLITRLFLTRGFTGRGGAIALARRGMAPGDIAQAVQGSAHPRRYAQYDSEARRILNAFQGGSGVAGGSARSVRETERYGFSQGPPDGPKNEDAWDMADRLGEEVGWRRFVVDNRFVFGSEEALMRQAPIMRITEGRRGVDRIDFDVRPGRVASEATVQMRAATFWTVPPGQTVDVYEMGIADGRWLVKDVSRGLFEPGLEVELVRDADLERQLREPAPQTRERTLPGGSGTRSRSPSRAGIGNFVRPVAGGTTGPGGQFGAPRDGGRRRHAGIDFAIPTGTAVRAAWGGTVSGVPNNPSGYGLYIDIRHSGGHLTRYAHLSRQGVRKGQRVRAGQIIGRSGNTGSSTGPHLHFEVHRSGVPVNPAQFL